MTRWVALLRGVNVGRSNRVAMADLRAVVTDWGATDVSTVLQSGNIVFDHPSIDEEALSDSLGAATAATLGLSVPVVLRPAGELAGVESAAAAAAERASVEPALLHVVFFTREVPVDLVDRVEPSARGRERVDVSGRHAFVGYRDGSARSKLTLDVIEAASGVTGTARNLNTVRRLLAVM